jgi:zinc protease
MINSILSELISHNSPFIYGYSYHGGTRDLKKRISLLPLFRGQAIITRKVLATENERAKKFGFTQAEPDRAK